MLGETKMFDGILNAVDTPITPVTQFLTDAKSLIDTPEKWVQGPRIQSRVRYKHKILGISFVKEHFTGYCSLGALGTIQDQICQTDHVDSNLIYTTCKQAEGFLDKALTTSHASYVHYNDDRNTTHQDIMALWDRAIELTKNSVTCENTNAV